MKQITYGLFVLLALITSCDDGDLTIETIDFENVNAQKCSAKDVIYKIKDSELLYIEIPASTFINDETPVNQPIEIPISSTVKVAYRQYQSTISQDNICPTIPSATPNLLEEWQATSGIIQITSTAVKTTNTTNNSTRITGYRHYIVFKNITFQKPNGNQVYETFVFGNYNTTITALPLNFSDNAVKSSCSQTIYNFNGSEMLEFTTNNYNTLFENSVTTTPRQVLLNNDNQLKYRLFNNVITNAYFCTSPTPSTPTLLQEWTGIAGETNVSGMIEVSTTTFGTGFQHTIRLKKVSLKKGNSTFSLGDDFLFGSFVTN